MIDHNPTDGSAPQADGPPPEAAFDALRAVIEVELRTATQGLSEYALLKRLQAAGILQSGRMDDSLDLFRIHFSLFHALYTLRDQLLAQSGERLSISPLLIRLEAAPAPGRREPERREPGRREPDEQELGEYDALRDYYLDLEHLRDTSRAEVEQMLNGFWKRMQGEPVRASGGRARALAALGLKDPVDKATIKRRYRSLVMQHHPDRGGDSASFQAINEAWRALI